MGYNLDHWQESTYIEEIVLLTQEYLPEVEYLSFDFLRYPEVWPIERQTFDRTKAQSRALRTSAQSPFHGVHCIYSSCHALFSVALDCSGRESKAAHRSWAGEHIRGTETTSYLGY